MRDLLCKFGIHTQKWWISEYEWLCLASERCEGIIHLKHARSEE